MKNNNELVTICIPSYNHALYIKNCLDSILQESYSNIEVDIIDDGSTDSSVEIIRKWQIENPNIKIRLYIQENKGLNYTLNKLVSNANGDYICFLSSDDALFCNSISKRVEVLKNHPKKLVVIGDSIVINYNNKVVYNSAIEGLYNGKKSNYMSDEKLKYSVINEFSIPGSNLLVKKNLYEIIGPYPPIFAEDINFYLKVIGLDLLIFLDDTMNYYRVHDNNTGGNPKHALRINKTFIYSYINNIKHYQWKYKLILIRKLLGRVYLYVKNYYFVSKQ
jgi:glycosyltransferase involved in cell wall biosynthesis